MARSCIVLSTGHVITGCPHDTESYRATAQHLGYGDDVIAMCCDHDPLHQAIAQWLGIGDSHSLRAAAGLPHNADFAVMEEEAVIAVQRYMKLAGGKLPYMKGK